MKFSVLNSGINGTDLQEINALLPQLNERAVPLSLDQLRDVAHRSFLVILRDGEGRIKGMATLSMSRIPTGDVGHVDDVVVDASLRGTGLGESLMSWLVNFARPLVDRLELTSHPGRVAANALYRKLGFELRETNCYVLKF